MLRLGIISDAHCEFDQAFPEIPSDIDLLILAGDIGNPYITSGELEKLTVPYFYIAGNHEFYGYEHQKVLDDIFNNSNGCYENGTMEFKGRRIHGCTLWTDMTKHGYNDFWGYNEFMVDSTAIKKWGGVEALKRHKESLVFLKESVKKGDIVVTHQSPTFNSVNEKYKADPHNHYFASNLDMMIDALNPALWVHGHMHDKCDYMLGGTRVICHPRGYPYEQSADDEYSIKVVEV